MQSFVPRDNDLSLLHERSDTYRMDTFMNFDTKVGM